jgi:hypothetical protein
MVNTLEACEVVLSRIPCSLLYRVSPKVRSKTGVDCKGGVRVVNQEAFHNREVAVRRKWNGQIKAVVGGNMQTKRRVVVENPGGAAERK